MTPDVDSWLTGRHQAVLVTVRSDGSPQSSNVVFTWDGSVARVSVTDDRAKTRNVRRDPRAVLHVLGDTFWDYAALAVDVEPSEVSQVPGDDVGRELLALRDAVSADPHPDPDEFFAAMVAERRLVLRLRVTSVASNGL